MYILDFGVNTTSCNAIEQTNNNIISCALCLCLCTYFYTIGIWFFISKSLNCLNLFITLQIETCEFKINYSTWQYIILVCTHLPMRTFIRRYNMTILFLYKIMNTWKKTDISTCKSIIYGNLNTVSLYSLYSQDIIEVSTYSVLFL